jgi:hypothetical protein
MRTRLSLLLLALILTAVAVPEAFGAKTMGGTLVSRAKSGIHHPKRHGDVLACDWFWIQCSDGTSDSCCGDVSSCGSYCQTVCGGPCEYVPNAD